MRAKVQNSALESFVKNDFKGYIDVAPRVGKTYIFIQALKAIREKYGLEDVVITVPYNTIITNSWEPEIIKWKLGFSPKVINQRSLNKIKTCDVLLLDEIHSLSENQRKEIQRINPKILLGGSGSISKDTKQVIHDELGLDCIYDYSLEEAINDGIISNYQINIVSCNLDNKYKNFLVKTKSKEYYTTEQSRYNTLSNMFRKFQYAQYSSHGAEKAKNIAIKMNFARLRSELIYTCQTKIELAKKIVEKNNRCLLFTTRTKVADEICEKSHHSKNKKEDNLTKFIEGEIGNLGVAQMIQMGITIPDLKVGVFHQMQSNEEAAIQKVLRMCNLEGEKKAEIFIVMLNKTVDEEWVSKAVSPFKNVKYLDYRNI